MSPRTAITSDPAGVPDLLEHAALVVVQTPEKLCDEPVGRDLGCSEGGGLA
jgi:hypothetical protein